MKLHPLYAAGAIVLALAACRPGTAEYTESEAPKTLTLDNATAHLDVRFAPGSSRPLPADAARLRALAASGNIAASDRVTVAAAGSPALATARFETIAAMLLPYRIIVSQRPPVAGPPNHAVVEAERYLVTAPPCPNWSAAAPLDYANAHASNFGCATAVNLGLMVASPADLAEGRPLTPADGQPAAAAVNRYLNEKVQLPGAAALGPIQAPAVGATGGAAGAAGSPQ